MNNFMTFSVPNERGDNFNALQDITADKHPNSEHRIQLPDSFQI